MPTDERKTGALQRWDPAKGFGFIEAQPRPIFVHRRAFDAHADPPEVGDHIAYVVGRDAQGRPCATEAAVVQRSGRRWWSLLGLLPWLALPGLALARWGPAGWGLAGGMLALSALTFVLYRADKRKSQTGAWRTPEAKLHLLELLGGWPGAFVAQRVLRHKLTKRSYQAIFWIVVGAYQFAALETLLGGRMLRTLWAWFWK